MGQYRVIVVDDEEEIREGIIRKIDWNALGYEVVGSAENGVEALELAEHLHPDVIMTDIKMSFMDGLQLCQHIAEKMPSVKMIIFSGFDDFEYAQRAIKLNVTEYLLKPVNAQELTQTLQKLKCQLDQELADQRDIEKLRRNYQESLPVLREQFLVGLLEGRVPQQRVQAQAEMFQLHLAAKYWTVALVHAEGDSAQALADATPLRSAQELVPLSVAKTVGEILGRFCHFTSFLYMDIVILADFQSDNDVTSLITGLNEVCKSASRVLGGDISAGVGGLCTDLNEISRSYQQAQSALDYSAIMGEGRAIYIKDVEPDTSVQLQFGEQEERALINAIKLGGEEEITKVVNELFSRFEAQLIPVGQYQVYLVELVTALLRVVRTYELNTDEVFGEEFNYFTTIFSHSPSKIRQWLIEACTRISAQVKRERLDSTKLLARNAKQYIEEHYMDPEISVEKLCAVLHVSPAYFSTVFKRETEMSFVSYLTEVRLQHALSLLNTTDDKTYVIAGKVGYTEPNYFSYVFKKRFGVSPSKYRQAAPPPRDNSEKPVGK